MDRSFREVPVFRREAEAVKNSYTLNIQVFCTTKEDIATDARIDFYILIRAFAAIVFIN